MRDASGNVSYGLRPEVNFSLHSDLLPLYDKYSVDLVLQGHDHLYARSQKLAGGKIVAPDAPGTVYMISVSGPKMYEIDHRFEPLMAKVIPNTQMFQVIDVDGDQMRLRAYSSEGDLLDGFLLMKKNGHSVYSELDKAATGATVGK